MKNITILLSLLFFLCINFNTLKASSLNKEENKDLIEKMSKSENVISYVSNSRAITYLLLLSKSQEKNINILQKIKIESNIKKEIELHNNYYTKISEEFPMFKEMNSIDKKQIMKSIIPNAQQNRPQSLKKCIWDAFHSAVDLVNNPLRFYSCVGGITFVELVTDILLEGSITAEILASIDTEMETCFEFSGEGEDRANEIFELITTNMYACLH